MHDLLHRPLSRRARVGALGAATVLAAASLAGCGGSDKTPAESKETTSSKLAAPSPPVALPDGVTLTPPGTKLGFGELATVFWAPSAELNAALNVTVKSAEHVTAADLKGFNLDSAYTKAAGFYFVNVSISNLGEGDLGGLDAPVSGVTADGMLLPPVVFESPFERCPSTPLPKKFATGATYEGCLVFAVPDGGNLQAVTFDPVESIEPIDWPGAAAAPIAAGSAE